MGKARRSETDTREADQPTDPPLTTSAPLVVRLTRRMLMMLCGELQRLSGGDDSVVRVILMAAIGSWQNEGPIDEDSCAPGEMLPDTWEPEDEGDVEESLGEQEQCFDEVLAESAADVPVEVLITFMADTAVERPREVLDLTVEYGDGQRLLGLLVGALQQPSRRRMDPEVRAVLSALLCQLRNNTEVGADSDRARRFTLTGWLVEQISGPLRTLADREQDLPVPAGTQEDLQLLLDACAQSTDAQLLGRDQLLHGTLPEQAAEDLVCALLRAREEPEFSGEWAALEALYCQIS